MTVSDKRTVERLQRDDKTGIYTIGRRPIMGLIQNRDTDVPYTGDTGIGYPVVRGLEGQGASPLRDDGPSETKKIGTSSARSIFGYLLSMQ